MGKLVRRAAIVLLPIAWSWYRSQRRERREGARGGGPGAGAAD
jgi:hypothetical protein